MGDNAPLQVRDRILKRESDWWTPFVIESGVIEPGPVSQPSAQIDIRKSQRQDLSWIMFGHNRREIGRDFVSKDWDRRVFVAALDAKIGEIFRMHKFDANIARCGRFGSGKTKTPERQKQQIKKLPHTIKDLFSRQNI